MESSLTLLAEYLFLFGNENQSKIPSSLISGLLKRAWTGSTCSMGLRGICWRVFLGLLSSENKGLWATDLKKALTSYQDLKTRVMPSIATVKADPLSGLVSDTTSGNDEWNTYYKNVELLNFIKGDLDRLFLNGIDDEYFQSKVHRDLLLAILFIWSVEHPHISYRQGMHEIVGSILYILDCERVIVQKNINNGQISREHPIFALFHENNLEAFTFSLFERIMLELEVLYDPLPVQGLESQPFVVHFCAKIQEHYLRILDPKLCQHLEESFVQSQLYGLRWSRLLLGREFPATHTHLFRLWDFMFASCYDVESGREPEFLDDDAPPNVYSVLANVRALAYNKNSNTGKRNSQERVTYVCTPLLGSLGDLMLAMLIQIRTKLIEADSSYVIGYLMRYPDGDSAIAVLECADMIRRGVIVQSIGYNGAVLNYHSDSMTPPKDYYPVGEGKKTGFKAIKPALTNVGRKVTDLGFSITAAVGSGLSDLVHSIANGIEGLEDDESSAHGNNSTRITTLNSPTPTGETNMVKRESKGVNRVKVEYDYEEEEEEDDGNGAASSKIVNINADPLLGTENIVQRTKKSNNLTGVDYSFKEPAVLNGMGKKYGNLPDALVDVPDPLAQIVGTPTSHGPKKGSKSLFSPNWFPSSSSKPKVPKDSEKAARFSAGVDLNVIQSSSSQDKEGNKEKDKIIPAQETLTSNLKKSRNKHQEDAVGDRLLDLADELLRFSTQHGDESNDIFVAVAKRLQGVVDVLSGYSSIVDYDTKYGNRTLPTSVIGNRTGDHPIIPSPSEDAGTSLANNFDESQNLE